MTAAASTGRAVSPPFAAALALTVAADWMGWLNGWPAVAPLDPAGTIVVGLLAALAVTLTGRYGAGPLTFLTVLAAALVFVDTTAGNLIDVHDLEAGGLRAHLDEWRANR